MASDSMTPPEFVSDIVQQSANPLPKPPNSDTVATGGDSVSQPTIDSASNNGVADQVLDEMPPLSHFKVLDSKEYAEKYRKYESEYTQLLMSKYFSGKNIYGGNIFEERTKIDNEIIMSSRWPCTRSYADPVKCFEEKNDEGSVPMEKSPCDIPNGDLPTEKSS